MLDLARAERQAIFKLCDDHVASYRWRKLARFQLAIIDDRAEKRQKRPTPSLLAGCMEEGTKYRDLPPRTAETETTERESDDVSRTPAAVAYILDHVQWPNNS